MRRKQPDTPQRRSESSQNEPGTGGRASGGFSAFTAADDRQGRGAAGPPPQILSGPGNRPGPAQGPGDRPGGTGASGKGGKNGKDGAARPGRYESFSPRNWRVPTRLVAILVVPVVIGLLFGGLRVNTSLDDFRKADRAVKTAELAAAATDLANALENERDGTIVPIMTGSDPKNDVSALRKKTDGALKAYNAAYKKISDDEALQRRNGAFQQLVVDLPHLRDNAYKPELLASATQAAYSVMFAPLLAIDNSVGFGSSNITSKGRAIYAMSLAKASASTQRALMLSLLAGITGHTVTPYETTELIQSLLVAGKLEQTAISEFNTGSTAADAKVYADALVAQNTADQRSSLRMPDGQTIPTMTALMNLGLSYSDTALQATAVNSKNQDQGKDLFETARASGLTIQNWQQASESHLGALRATESALLTEVVGDAANIKSRAQNDAILNSSIVIAALALAGLLTGFIARSMILGMRTLNTAALDIANRRLPDLVEKLSKTDPDRVDTSVSPIPLHGTDEIGEVARAFDQVHAQAVSLAAEQALLRGNLNAIFSNLSRRSQSLIQRQLALITDLENNEADPDQLENLFKLDHLATRMRRNGENLLVLAGEEPGRRWNTPVPLVDVLRAAASEVEQYERIELAGIPEAEIVGPAVTDLVHLLAELLENATTFSSPQTRVLVNATRLPDGRVLVEIHDKGIGLTADDFAEINEKLAEPPTVDATISRRMGLFVVGRLSQRHDVRVQLRPSGESAGTTSLVMLPQALIHSLAPVEPEEEFTVSRIFADQEPTQSWQQDWQGQRSAAELGFDDHLTGAGSSGFSPALEAMQRSQHLNERRRTAALEPAPDDRIIDAETIEPDDRYDGRQDQGYDPQGYDPQAGYQDQGYDPQGYDPQAGYQDQGYDPQGYSGPQGYDPQAGYQDQGYDQQDGYDQGYQGAQYADAGYDAVPAQQGYQDQGYDQYGYDGRAAGHPYPAEEAPALPAAPAAPTTAGGLPQRRPGQQLAGGGFGGDTAEEKPNWFTGAKDTSGPEESRGHEVSSLGGYGPTGPTGPSTAWQSANDGSWQRAEQSREPMSGGTTQSGLPRRVPKQNLVPGNAKPAPTEGPQVSRNPEEVRGRLTNLRRGVEQGRNAGGDPGTTGSFRVDPNQGRNGNQNSSTDLFGGSNHQER